MKTIYKYPLAGAISKIAMPEGAKVIFTGIDDRGRICLWVEVDTTRPAIERQFSIVGTGQAVFVRSEHVGTVIQKPFVWHVREEWP